MCSACHSVSFKIWRDKICEQNFVQNVGTKLLYSVNEIKDYYIMTFTFNIFKQVIFCYMFYYYTFMR